MTLEPGDVICTGTPEGPPLSPCLSLPPSLPFTALSCVSTAFQAMFGVIPQNQHGCFGLFLVCMSWYVDLECRGRAGVASLEAGDQVECGIDGFPSAAFSVV